MYECVDFVCAVPCVLQGVGVYSCGFAIKFHCKVFSRENSMSITRLNISQTEYRAIHQWIQNNYGKALGCSNPDCQHKSETYQWCLIKGKEHCRDMNNYRQLCATCHLIYDYDEERRARMRASMKGRNRTFNDRQANVIRSSYAFGVTLKDLAGVFNTSDSTIMRYTKGVRLYREKNPRDPMSRKYNPKQIRVMKAMSGYGASCADISRLFHGSDKDRATIHRAINDNIYV